MASSPNGHPNQVLALPRGSGGGGTTDLHPAIAATVDTLITEGWLEPAVTSIELRRRAADWRRFQHFCKNLQLSHLPASESTLLLYVVSRLETVQPATLRREIRTIRHEHENAGHASPPTARADEVMRGSQKSDQSDPTVRAHPILLDDLRTIIDRLDGGYWDGWSPDPARNHLQTLRWRCMLLTGWAGALRPSELLSIRLGWIHTEASQLHIRLPRTKHNPEGRSLCVAAASNARYCPVQAFHEWRQEAARCLRVDNQTPLLPTVARYGTDAVIDPYRRHAESGQSPTATSDAELRKVRSLVINEGPRFTRLAEQTGITPKPDRRLTLYGLRRGIATEAIRHGAHLEKVRRHLGHAEATTTVGYIDLGSVSPLEALA